MATNFKRFFDGIRIFPKPTSTVSVAGDVDFDTTSNKLNLHNGTSSSPAVTENHAATLTNKAFVDGSTTFTAAADATKKLLFTINGATGAQTTIISNSSANRVINLPDSSDILVGQNTSDTLTNKTLTNPVINNPTGITAANVGLGNVNNTSDATKNAATATLTNKSLSDSTTSIVDATDATKKILFDAAGTTGTSTTITGSQTANRILTLPDTTDTLVGKATTDILTNKSIDGGTNALTNIPTTALNGIIPISKGGTGQTTANAAFNALSPMTTAGDLIYGGTAGAATRLAAGLSNQVLKFVSGVPVWSNINTSGINYISGNPDAETDTSGWNLYQNTAGVSPVNGASGTPLSSFIRSTSSPLRGAASFVYGKPASNTQGEGVAYDFVIDSADTAKMLTISFDYSFNNLNLTAGDMRVYIYDITSNVVISPSAPFIIPTIANAPVKFTTSFQSSSNSVSYRLCIHTATAASSAFNLKFDNLYVGPQSLVNIPVLSDWTSYTPTFTAMGTVTSPFFWYRRNGDSVEIMGKWTFPASGQTNTEARVSLPPGLTSDSNKISGVTSVGGYTGQSVSQAVDIVTLVEPGVTYLTFGLQTGTTPSLTKTTGTGLSGSAFTVSITARVPITGWGSNVLASADTDTRIVSFEGYVGTATTLTANVSYEPFVARKDSHGAWNGSSYTVPVAGDYYASLTQSITGQASFFVVVNGATYKLISVNPTSGQGSSGSVLIPNLSVGSTIAFRPDSNNTTIASTLNTVSIFRLSGPSTIAPTESISTIYGLTTAQSLTTANPIKYDTKVKDSHSAYSVSSGLFTAPANGTYRISISGSASSGTANLVLKINGVGVGYYFTMPSPGYIYGGSISYPLTAGATVGIYSDGTVTAQGSSASGFTNIVSIERTGN